MRHVNDTSGADQRAWRFKLARLTATLNKLPDESARGPQVLPPNLKLDDTLEHLTAEEKEFVRAKLTEQADFFATRQYPSRIEGTEPIDIDTADHPPVKSRYRQLSPQQQRSTTTSTSCWTWG